MHDHEHGSDPTTDTDEGLLDRASKANPKDVSPRDHERESEHPAGRVAAEVRHRADSNAARRKPGKR